MEAPASRWCLLNNIARRLNHRTMDNVDSVMLTFEHWVCFWDIQTISGEVTTEGKKERGEMSYLTVSTTRESHQSGFNGDARPAARHLGGDLFCVESKDKEG
ncbi:hypothetical protein V6N13_008304 [Hibiscus sabdariffa]